MDAGSTLSDVHGLDRLARAAPPAGHVLDRLLEDLLVLDRQLPADREVVERPRPAGRGDVEAREVAARRAAVPNSRGSHGRRRYRPVVGTPAGRFEPGQVVTVFRSRLRPDAAPGYDDEGDEVLELARRQPGFVDFKSFRAEDGEKVSIVTFADRASHDAWRHHARHVEAQRRGRDGWYAAYAVQVSVCTDARSWTA